MTLFQEHTFKNIFKVSEPFNGSAIALLTDKPTEDVIGPFDYEAWVILDHEFWELQMSTLLTSGQKEQMSDELRNFK